MVEYECKRCGYKNNNKTNMKKHLQKKKPCNILLYNISREDCITLVYNNEDVCEFYEE
jgi:hypothetical protein